MHNFGDDPRNRPNIYTVGGTVQAGDGLYIERQADQEILELCHAGHYAYVLTARQMGKSSLMVRTAERLGQEGVLSAILDLTELGVQASPEAWYLGLLFRISSRLGLKTDFGEWWQAHAELGPTQRLALFFQEIVLAEVSGQMVVFLDEIDTTLGLDYTDDFFTAIRYLYNARALEPELRRLSFVLIGVATPSELIADPKRTPFNIGQRIDLTDFTPEEAEPFAQGLPLPETEARQVLDWVLRWTGGHPYLTQRLCAAIAGQGSRSWSESDVYRLVGETFFGEMSERDDNLLFVQDMLLRRAPDRIAVLQTYREILTSRQLVLDSEQSAVKAHLKLSGVVKREGKVLKVRNPIYAQVFDRRWIQTQWPVSWWQLLPRPVKVSAIIIVALLAVLVFTTVFALNEQRRALQNEQLAESRGAEAVRAQKEAERQAQVARSGQLAALSQAAGVRYPILSLLLAHESVNVGMISGDPVLTSGEEALRLALKEPRGVVIGQHAGAVTSLAISPDGRWLATGGEDTTAWLWDLQAKDLPAAGIALPGHDGAINALAISPNGRWLATGSQDMTARLWDLQTPDPSSNPLVLRGHDGPIMSLEISPDVRWLATGSEDTTARLWDLRLKDPSAEVTVLNGHEDWITDLAFSPDSRQLATVGWNDGSIRMWDFSTGGPPSADVLGSDGFVNSVVYSPDGRWMASGGADIRLFEIARNSIEPVRSEESSSLKPVFSPDRRWLVFGGFQTARLWDLQEGSTAEHEILLPGHDDRVIAAFSPDSHWLATGSEDNMARLWNLQADDPASSPTLLRGHDGPINDLAFSPDGRWLVTISGDGLIRRWDLTEIEPNTDPLPLPGKGSINKPAAEDGVLSPFDSHFCAITRPLIIPGGRWLATCGEDKTIRLWNLRADDPSANPVVLAISSEMGGNLNMTASPDGHWLATISDGTRLWDLSAANPELNPIAISDVEDQHGGGSLAFSTDGRLLATTGSGYGEDINIWEVSNLKGAPVLILNAVAGFIDQLAFSPNGNWLLATRFDFEDKANSTALLWDLRQANQPQMPVELSSTEESYPVFSPDGRWLATVADDHNSIKLWDLSAADPIANPLLMPGQKSWIGLGLLTFSPDGHRLAATRINDYSVLIWDLSAAGLSSAPLVLSGHDEYLASLAFSSDGRWLATGSYDTTIRIWDLSAEKPSANPRVLRGHETSISNVSFSLDGRWLVSSDENNVTLLWHLKLDELIGLACRAAGRNFTQQEWQQYFPGESYRKTCEELPEGN